ncbi:MAG: hypothetical protein HFH85_09560 [Lachnospiraceae bacterium]|nr:hypothetical protein [Lachnospiraceae bacterium]
MYGIFNYIFFISLCIVMVYPFWHVVMMSLSSVEATAKGGVFLWPKGFNLDPYTQVFKDPSIWTGYLTTVLVGYTQPDSQIQKWLEERYNLDMRCRISEADKAQIPGQVEMYHKYNDLIREGIIIGLTLPGRTISMIAGRWYHQGGEGIRSEYLLLAFQPFLGRCI